jgi:hypothetical protein
VQKTLALAALALALSALAALPTLLAALSGLLLLLTRLLLAALLSTLLTTLILLARLLLVGVHYLLLQFPPWPNNKRVEAKFLQTFCVAAPSVGLGSIVSVPTRPDIEFRGPPPHDLGAAGIGRGKSASSQTQSIAVEPSISGRVVSSLF